MQLEVGCTELINDKNNQTFYVILKTNCRRLFVTSICIKLKEPGDT